MNNKFSKTTAVLSAFLAATLMAAGCSKEPERAVPQPAVESVQEDAGDEQLPTADTAKSDEPAITDETAQAESEAPTDMGELLHDIEDRIASDKDYGGSKKDKEGTTQGQLVKKGKTHTVTPGDTLASIAKSHYGDSAMYMAIYEANRDILSDPGSLEVGQVLDLP